MVLRLEVGGLDGQDVGERRLLVWRQRLEGGVREELREARGGEDGLGGDVDCRLGEAARWWQLHGEQEGQQQLRLASATGGGSAVSVAVGRRWSTVPLAGDLDEVAGRDAAAESGIERVVEGAD